MATSEFDDWYQRTLDDSGASKELPKEVVARLVPLIANTPLADALLAK